jgi:uncharacterized membrane protein
MRSLKKLFLTGIICVFVVWIITELSKLIYKFVEPIRDPFFKIFHSKSLGIEFAVTILIILSCGFLITILSHLKSKIPIVSHLFGFTKMISGISRKMQTGEIKVVMINSNNSCYLGFTTGVKKSMNGQEYIAVFRPFTPNITSGFTLFFSEEDFKKLPQVDGKLALKLLFHGWLSQTKDP